MSKIGRYNMALHYDDMGDYRAYLSEGTDIKNIMQYWEVEKTPTETLKQALKARGYKVAKAIKVHYMPRVERVEVRC